MPGAFASSLRRSTSARKKLSNISRLDPLPRLLIGMLSSPEIVTALNTSAHFRLEAGGMTGHNVLAISGLISRSFSRVRVATSCSFPSTISAT